jgi:hypothetical protein
MASIKRDKLRITNAKQFVVGITTTTNSYYTFIGLLNPEAYKSDWNISPQLPRDNFSEEDDYWDTMIALKKVKVDDVRMIVKKNVWTSGTVYDMYRHDISVVNTAKPSGATSLFTSNYYVINSNYDVYICLNNGTNPEYPSGRPSLDEPFSKDLEPATPGTSGDGYIWKYLYTIKPSDIIKFDSKFYIPLPREWGADSQTSLVKNNAITSGQLKTVVIKNRGLNVGTPNSTYANVPIKGDGSGALATIVVNNDSKIDSITVSSGGSNYTYGSVDLAGGGVPLGTTRPEFDVIIPPSGGHGFDIYNELGSYRVMVQVQNENDETNPDFIQQNEFSRVGLIQNPQKFNSNTLLTDDKVSALYALKLIGITSVNDYKNAKFSQDSIITQTVGTGITAAGRVASYDYSTGVLKYWQDRSLAGFNTDGTQNNTPIYGFNLNRFTPNITSGGSLVISGESNNLNLRIDSSFGTESNPGITTVINNRTYQLGQSFIGGVSQPEVKKYSGDILTVENRASIPRSPNQKENIKINIQF